MLARLLRLWERVRTSLWFVPAGLSLAATALAVAAGHLDTSLAASGADWPLVYAGDREGARLLLSTVAGSMITVAGVTFSVTVVALSLAASQFGPRLLVNFMRDTGNQLVLGTYIATFLFCLLALGSGLGAADPDVVPAVSASVGLLLAVVSVAVLIYFIHHVSSSMRAGQVVDAVARDVEQALERIFPERGAPEERTEAALPDFAGAAEVPAPSSGYLQGVDEAGLLAAAAAGGVVVRALRRPGHFVVEGEPLAVAAGGAVTPELERRIQAAFLVGRQRTPEQDPEYGIHQLVEVAVRALSPGINDPFTALSCVDWLGAILSRAAARPEREPLRRDAAGAPRVLLDPTPFPRLLAAAFEQVRQYAQATPAVSMRLLEALSAVARRASSAERRDAIREQGEMVFRGALSAGLQDGDRRDLEQRYEELLGCLEPGGEGGAGGIAQV